MCWLDVIDLPGVPKTPSLGPLRGVSIARQLFVVRPRRTCPVQWPLLSVSILFCVSKTQPKNAGLKPIEKSAVVALTLFIAPEITQGSAANKDETVNPPGKTARRLSTAAAVTSSLVCEESIRETRVPKR